MSRTLQGKVVAVVGTGGLGRALAVSLAGRGATVIVAGRSGTVDVRIDLTDADAVRRWLSMPLPSMDASTAS